MKFKQIVLLDKVGLSESAVEKLAEYSDKPIKIFSSDPADEAEVCERISDADCIMLTWRTPISKEVLSKCKELKFICLCATNSNNIDLDECAKKGITVSNVHDYGDEGVVEWIIMQLLLLFRGIGDNHYREFTAELSGKTIGIFGMGVVGKLLAKAAIGLGMNVLYNSKTRNAEIEKLGIQFADKSSLLAKSDIISLHTPKNVKILDKSDFDLMQRKILVNTTLGKAFDSSDFVEWIKQEGNFAIMDNVSDFGGEFKDLGRVVYSDIISGKTIESIERLSQKALDNIHSYISGNPINIISNR